MPDSPYVTRACAFCGADFITTHVYIRRGRGRFCSNICGSAARTIPAADRFWAKVEKSPEPDGCWLWTGSTNNKGYGCFTISAARRNELAHRYAWEMAEGAPAAGKVLHTCDTPACVRRSHLFTGTQRDNLQDAKRKGRTKNGTHTGRAHLGEQHHRAKLTESDVREIRTRYAAGGISYGKLAWEYRVDASVIRAVVIRRSWRHVV